MTPHSQQVLDKMNHTANPEVAALVVYLRSHGVTVKASTENVITVEGVYPLSFYLENGTRMHTTEKIVKVETLPAHFAAVREWLGY